MDLLHWRNLNGQVKFEPTKKQYYSRYLWRLVYTIKKVHLATDKHVHDVVQHVRYNRHAEQQRKQYAAGGRSTYDYYGYGYSHRNQDWTNVDEVTIDRVRTVINTFKETVKFRVEWNNLQVYAETEDDLKRIAEAISYNEGITTLTSPKPGTEDALRQGHVFMPKMDYKYKVVLRDGQYPVDIKASILMQLSQRDDVKIPANLKRELGKSYPALWGAYFYSNDDSIVTVLSLISPGIVGKIHPIDHH